MCRVFLRLLLLSFAVCLVHVAIAQRLSIDSSHFYYPEKIQDIRIVFPEDVDWQYVLDSLRVNGDEMLLATVEINGQRYEDVGVRYHASRGFRAGQKRNSFDIQLDYVRADQHYQGYRNLYLSDARRDPSMVRQVLGYEIARQYMPAPLANYARLTIGSGFYGLMVNVQPIDEVFLRQYFGTDQRACFVVSELHAEEMPRGCIEGAVGALIYEESLACYQYNFEARYGKAWDALKHLAAVLRNKDEAAIAATLDVDAALWMHAFNNVLVNLYSYSGHPARNYWLYQDSTGRFVPILGRLNYAFGSYKNVGNGSDLPNKRLVTLDPWLHRDNANRPLISSLLAQPEWRNRYVHHMQVVLNDHFVHNQWLDRAKALRRLIRKDYARDPSRYYSMEDFDNALNKTIGQYSRIPGLVRLMVPRSNFLRKHEALRVIPPQFGQVQFTHRKRYSTDRVTTFQLTVPVGKKPDYVRVWYRFAPTMQWQVAELYDDGHHGDGKAHDGVFGLEIVPPDGQDALEYFLEAGNVASVNFYPASYMWGGLRVTLEELN